MSEMAPAPKDARFEFRLSIDEREMLRSLSEDMGESEAIVLRQLIRKAFEASQVQGQKKKR
jgi:predicted DNA-binding protein